MSRRSNSVRYTPVDPSTFDWDRWLDDPSDELYYIVDTPEPHHQLVITTRKVGHHTLTTTTKVITNNPTFGPYKRAVTTNSLRRQQ